MSAPILCYVTDRLSLRAVPPATRLDALLHKIQAAAGAGIDWIQIREKDLPDSDCAALTRAALDAAATSATPSHHAKILINGRPGLALAANAHGAHLAEDSLAKLATKKVWNAVNHSLDRPDGLFLIGVSSHSLESASEAESHGADYIIFGPVFETPSKARFGAPQGLDRLAEVCNAVSIPVLAIGGISLANAASCLAAGAAGIAAIRLFQDAPDLPGLVQALHTLP